MMMDGSTLRGRVLAVVLVATSWGCGDDMGAGAGGAGGDQAVGPSGTEATSGGGGESAAATNATGASAATATSTGTAATASSGAGGAGGAGATPEVLFNGSGFASNLVVRDGWVYFSQFDADDFFANIRRVATNGGLPQLVRGEVEPFFAASETTLFYQAFGELLSRPLAGGAATVLAQGDHAATSLVAMVHAEGSCYRAHKKYVNGPDPDAFSRTVVATGEVEDLVLDEPLYSYSLATPPFGVTATALFWGGDGVQWAALADGTRGAVEAAGTGDVLTLGTDNEASYFVASGANAGKLMRADEAGAETVFDDADGEWGIEDAQNLLVTGAHVYLAMPRRVVRLGLRGGEPLAYDTEGTVASIAQEGSRIYWVENLPSSGGVRISVVDE
jgi:hypothetical protein